MTKATISRERGEGRCHCLRCLHTKTRGRGPGADPAKDRPAPKDEPPEPHSASTVWGIVNSLQSWLGLFLQFAFPSLGREWVFPFSRPGADRSRDVAISVSIFWLNLSRQTHFFAFLHDPMGPHLPSTSPPDMKKIYK